MGNMIITLLELAAGAAIVFGFIYEKKLIAFEDCFVLFLKKLLKKQTTCSNLRVAKRAEAKHCA